MRALPLILVGVTVSLALPARAQDDALEEIVVTARKRIETSGDVPISIAVVDDERLRETGATELDDIAAYVPGFTVNETGISTTIAIRGIGSGINQGFEQSVGMYVDGIYYGRDLLARAPLFDLERVEIVRGPQPILFGKNSIAGAVSMVTAKPTDEFEASLAAAYGPDRGELNWQLAAGGPLTERFRARVALFDRRDDGYMTNVYLGRKEQQEDESAARVSLAWEPTDSLLADLKLEHASFDALGRATEIVHSIALPTGGIDYLTALGGTVAAYNAAVGAGLAPPPPIPYLADDGLLDHVKSSGTHEQATELDNATLNVEYRFGAHALTFVLGYAAYESSQLCDCDFVSAPIIDGSTLLEEFRQSSQEIRWTSPSGERLEYIVGVYRQSADLTYADKINVPPDGVLRALAPVFANIDTRRAFDQRADLTAAFAELTWNATDALRLTAGGRYTTDEKAATRVQVHHAGGAALPPTDPAGLVPNVLWGVNPLFGEFMIEPYAQIADERDESKFTPLLSAEWDLSETVMLYGAYVRGFKSGGFDTRSNGHPDPTVVNAQRVFVAPVIDIVGVFEYDDEGATAVELGAKTTLLQGRAELNAALYHTDYEDLQTSVFDGTLGFNVVNAARATVKGVEADGRWAVTERISLAGSVAYLDFEYDEFTLAQCYFNDPRPPTGRGTCDASGNRKENAPEWTGTFVASYDRPLDGALRLTVGAELVYSDDYIWSPTLDPVARQDAFTELNLRLGVGKSDGTWELALAARNLTDEDVSVFGGNATLAGALTGGTGNAYYTFADEPRDVTLQGVYRFGAR